MINVFGYNEFHIKNGKTCPYCNNKEYSATGLCNMNGIEIACDTCGQIYYIPYSDITSKGVFNNDTIGYGF